MKRLVSPVLNPAGLMAAAGAVYAAVVMISNAAHHHGIIDPAVIVAAATAVAALLTRQVVTPVADPRDGNGDALVRASAAAQAGPPGITITGSMSEAQMEAIKAAVTGPAPAQGAAGERKVPPMTISREVPPASSR